MCRDADVAVYAPIDAQLAIYETKPAVFDLVLAAAIGLYLTGVYYAVMVISFESNTAAALRHAGHAQPIGVLARLVVEGGQRQGALITTVCRSEISCCSIQIAVVSDSIIAV